MSGKIIAKVVENLPRILDAAGSAIFVGSFLSDRKQAKKAAKQDKIDRGKDDIRMNFTATQADLINKL